MPHVTLPDGRTAWPALGLGTWRMGEAARPRRAEVAAVRQALEIGYRLIDTAEMYGDGGAEEVVGEALAEALRAGVVTRDEVVVVSKVLPSNASRRGTLQACGPVRQVINAGLLRSVWRVDARIERCSRGLPQVVVDGAA